MDQSHRPVGMAGSTPWTKFRNKFQELWFLEIISVNRTWVLGKVWWKVASDVPVKVNLYVVFFCFYL